MEAGADEDLIARILASYADRQALVERDALNVGELAARIEPTPMVRIPEQSDEVHDLAGLLALDRYLLGGA